MQIAASIAGVDKLVELDENGEIVASYPMNDMKLTDRDVVPAGNDEYIGVGGLASPVQQLVFFRNGEAETIWTKVLPSNERVWDICDALDGFLIIGSTYSSRERLTLKKVDRKGNTIWEKIYANGVIGEAAERLEDGSFIVSGERAYSNDPSSARIWYAHISATSDILWEKELSTSPAFVNDMVKCGDGNFILTGKVNGAVIPGSVKKGGTDAFLLKINTIGDVIWARNIGSALEDVGYKIRKMTSGDCAVLGFSRGNSDEVVNPFSDGSMDGWIYRFVD